MAETVASLTHIFVYPIKSTRGVSLTTAAVEPWGLADDRRWAIVDENGEKVWAKSCPSIMKITGTRTLGGGLVLTAPGAPALVVAAPRATNERIPTNFPSVSRAVVAGSAAQSWLTEILDRPARLVWLDDRTHRSMSLSLAGAGPLLLTSASSLRLLDKWIAIEANL